MVKYSGTKYSPNYFENILYLISFRNKKVDKSTKMLGVFGRHLGRQKDGIEMGSGELYPNYPNSLGMFQTKAVSGWRDYFVVTNLRFILYAFLQQG